MVNIFLKNNKGFNWYNSKNIFVKGCFYDDSNNYYEKEDAISYFKNIDNFQHFISKIKTINGIFTVIINTPDELFMTSDNTRIFPVFYIIKDGKLNISDDIVYLKNKFNIKDIDKNSSNEFLASGHTIGNKTLLKNIFQLQSSEYLHYKNNKLIKRGHSFNYSTNKLNSSPYSELKLQAITAFENSFKRLIESLKSRQVILPLSGGYDSRLIAVMLKKFNYTNVICYTYGKENNLEIENSKKTAEVLNFKWFFIEYTDELIGDYINCDVFKKFVHYSSKYSSMPSLQDYFAVKYLSDNKLINSDSIFIPGHSGDLLGGSQFKKVIPNRLSSKKISNLILKTKFDHNLVSRKSKRLILNNIKNQIVYFDKNYKEKLPYSVFEDYDIKEKISKLIFKASNVYTFFDYEHRFPFWDKEVLSFFKNVPIEYKIMKVLFDDVLKNNYFKIYNVNFENEIQPKLIDIYFQKFKEKLKPHFPYYIKKRYLNKNDWLNSKEITNQMAYSLSFNNIQYFSNIRVFNELNIQWYLYFCKNLIKNKK